MKICGIIAEYNPFHKGHEYHIGKAKSLTGCDFVVVCMSGDYVQRGLPAITNKYNRAKAALYGGADLVIELPAVFATSSAENFAYGAVNILDKIGCDYICFGSELDDISVLKHMAQSYDDIERNYAEQLSSYQKSGLSYAKAIENVYSDIAPSEGDIPQLLSNDKLGIAYIRAMNKIGSKMEVATVKRVGGDYLESSPNCQSAMAARKMLSEKENKGALADLIPSYSLSALCDDKVDEYEIVEPEDFSDLLYMKLISILNASCDNEDFRGRLKDYLDVSDNIAGRIINNLETYIGFDDFADRVHSPEYTQSRIYRSLVHILLDITTDDIKKFIENDVSYARILGFNKNSAQVLSHIKNNSRTKLISKIADAENILSENELCMLKTDIFAADLYDYAEAKRHNKPRKSEYRKSIVYCS